MRSACRRSDRRLFLAQTRGAAGANGRRLPAEGGEENRLAITSAEDSLMSDDDKVLRGGKFKPPAAPAAEEAASRTGGDVKEKVVGATNGLIVLLRV